MLLHSNVLTRIQIVSKVLSRDFLNTKLKFLVPLSIVNFLFLDGDVPCRPSYGVYITQLIRFARVISHVDDLNTLNKCLIAKLLEQGYLTIS